MITQKMVMPNYGKMIKLINRKRSNKNSIMSQLKRQGLIDSQEYQKQKNDRDFYTAAIKELRQEELGDNAREAVEMFLEEEYIRMKKIESILYAKIDAGGVDFDTSKEKELLKEKIQNIREMEYMLLNG